MQKADTTLIVTKKESVSSVTADANGCRGIPFEEFCFCVEDDMPTLERHVDNPPTAHQKHQAYVEKVFEAYAWQPLTFSTHIHFIIISVIVNYGKSIYFLNVRS